MTRVPGWASSWTSLGGLFQGESAAISWGPGRIDLFGIGDDNGIWWKAYADGKWSSSWTSLGGNFKSPPTVVSRRSGGLDVFAIDSSSGSLLHKAYQGGAWQSEWENLGGVLFSAVSAVTSSFFGIDRIDIFALGGTKMLFQKTWTGTAWIDWISHGASFISEPVVTSWCPNRLDVLGLGDDKAMWHQAWNGTGWMPSGSITAWESTGGVFKVFP